MRRLANMNFSRLFKHECDVPGHNEMMISIFPEECPFVVYDYKYFIDDEFDAFSFGVEYKKEESPMEILISLREKFPMPSFLNRDPSSINSEYSNGGRNTKNAYYAFACYSTENVWYTAQVDKTRYVMDSIVITDSEFIYGSVFCKRLYKCSYAFFSNDCSDSMFLFDCRNCVNCFGCVNQRNAKYCVYNKQYSKKEYEIFMSSIFPLSREKISLYEDKFWELVKSLPMNGTRNVASDNVFGVNIKNSKNLYDVIDANHSEHIRHADGVISHKD